MDLTGHILGIGMSCAFCEKTQEEVRWETRLAEVVKDCGEILIVRPYWWKAFPCPKNMDRDVHFKRGYVYDYGLEDQFLDRDHRTAVQDAVHRKRLQGK